MQRLHLDKRSAQVMLTADTILRRRPLVICGENVREFFELDHVHQLWTNMCQRLSMYVMYPPWEIHYATVGGFFHRWRSFPLGELREHYERLPPIVFPYVESHSPSAPSKYLLPLDCVPQYCWGPEGTLRFLPLDTSLDKRSPLVVARLMWGGSGLWSAARCQVLHTPNAVQGV